MAGLKLGAAVYKELLELRFLDPSNSAAIGRYEGMIKFIQDKHGLTRAEIETHYSNGIRGLVTEIVNEEFNKVSFLLENTSIRKAHNAILARNPQTGYYTLSYGGVNTNNETREIKNIPTLDALLDEMGRRSSDFDQTGINQVRAQAVLIQAVVYSAAVRDDMVNVITAFYLNPNTNTADALMLKHGNLWRMDGARGEAAASSFSRALHVLCEDLPMRVLN